MYSMYPKSPKCIPPTFTNISRDYKKKVWLAFVSLCIFVLMYLLLVSWFSYQSYYLVSSAMYGSNDSFFAYVFGACSIFISLFLLKGLFFVNRKSDENRFEITAKEQPELFKFIYTLADEAGSPRPYKVFLSAEVNACVFYNLSLLDLILPTNKNLEIGLGLVNVLTLGELKAVIAHEFGHFSQKSMMLGTWVYVAQQVASHFIHQRDGFDSFLRGLSSIDFRIAWIGWILNLIVWSLRSILEIVFRLVVIAQRSLSREMEMHADKVAVSLSGSDELIHALYKLNSGDICWESSMEFANDEFIEDRLIENIFEIQSVLLEKFRKIYSDETFNDPPEIPSGNQKNHRVFKEEKFHPPKMWATHPSNFEREKNAKSEYVYVELDKRSSWDLFEKQTELKVEMTKHLLNYWKPNEKATLINTADSLQNLHAKYDKEVYRDVYKGTYISRSLLLPFDKPDHVYLEELQEKDFNRVLGELYPDTQTEKVREWGSLCAEKRSLSGILNGSLTTPDGVIRHRNKVVSKRSLPELIIELDKEISISEANLSIHDRLCRTIHKSIAKNYSKEWEEYLSSLLALLHYAEHGEADLIDAFAHLHNELKIVTADGRVSDTERIRLLKATEEVRVAIYRIYNLASDLSVPSEVKVALKIESWSEIFSEKLGLQPADVDTIDQWLEVVDSWYFSCLGPMSILRHETLEVLLKQENYLKETYQTNSTIGSPPITLKIPDKYSTLTPNKKRYIQTELSLWNRFVIAEGVLPSVSRTIVSMGVLGGLVYFSQLMDTTIVYVFNGLKTRVNVRLGDKTVNLMPEGFTKVELNTSSNLKVVSKSSSQELIDNIVVDASNGYSTYVYNVGGASPMTQWSVAYGKAEQEEPVYHGVEKWFVSNADVFFRDPPKKVYTKYGDGMIKRILGSQAELSPSEQLNYIPDQKSVFEAIVNHSTWDADGSEHILTWLHLASKTEGFDRIIAKRLKRNPTEIFNLRAQQVYADKDKRKKICVDQNLLYEKSPQNIDFLYLKIRCIDDQKARSKSFLEAHNTYPQHIMLAFGASYSYLTKEDWKNGIKTLEYVLDKSLVLRQYAVIELSRVYRLLAKTDPKNSKTYLDKITEYTKYSKQLALLESVIKKSNDLNDPYDRYRLLNKGKVSAAIDQASKESPNPEFLRLAAASDGASAKDIDLALKLKIEEGLSDENIWFTIGLHIKHNVEYKAYLTKLLEQEFEGKQELKKFIIGLEKGTDYKELEILLKSIDWSKKGYIYNMATIVLGVKAPLLWRTRAKAFLFEAERPYFK